MTATPLRVTALAASAQLGGTERVLLDFAERAFEHDIALRVLVPRDGPLIELLNQSGVPARVVPAPKIMLRGSQQRGRLWSALPAAMALPLWARSLRSHKFCQEANVLYSVGFKSHLATTLPFGKKVVWHLHEFPPQTTGRAWKMLARRVPDALIANSKAVAEAWDGQTVRRSDGQIAAETGTNRPTARPSDRLVVVPNGVDLDRFKPRERTGWIHQALGIPAPARLVGMPAVFARWKGHEVVIEAFRSIAESIPDAHLVFVGGSIYDTIAEREFGEALHESIRLSNLGRAAPQFHILGFQPRIELVYPELDVTVHYSLRPEPFGRVILESMACGVPVLAAAEGGPLEILEGVRSTQNAEGQVRSAQNAKGVSVGGWLVPPRDAASLSSSLRRALSLAREELWQIGHLGRVRAEDHFSARAFARKVADVFAKL
ncbi:MAG: glycosyltransferase family 4 protein [Gemmatimonadetes bacterium]|nr:glycosyltransferase family 4 protein [Gemmatimonadota bacterium]